MKLSICKRLQKHRMLSGLHYSRGSLRGSPMCSQESDTTALSRLNLSLALKMERCYDALAVGCSSTVSQSSPCPGASNEGRDTRDASSALKWTKQVSSFLANRSQPSTEHIL